MAGAVVRVHSNGIPAAVARLERMADAASDARPALRAIRDEWRADNDERFRREGPGWKRLSPRYAAWKALHYPGRTILVRTGRLRRTLTTNPNVNRITRSRLTVGSTVPYGAKHDRGKGKLPARPLRATAAQQTKYRRILACHVVGGQTRGVISFTRVAVSP